MTKFILYIATSLDGYIARSDGSIDWLPLPEAVNQVDNSYITFYNSIDALVMGSKTYEQALGFGDWPYPGKLSYVLTSRNLSSDRADITFMNNVEAAIADIQKREYRCVWVIGGGEVASWFVENGLVDEYFIFIIPIILGSGISLYPSAELKLHLVGTKIYPLGIVELHYEKG